MALDRYGSLLDNVIDMAASILFVVQDVGIPPKFSERHFSENSFDSKGRSHDFSEVVAR